VEADARRCGALDYFDAEEAVELLLPEISDTADEFLREYVIASERPANPPLSTQCKHCEYRAVGDDGRCGFQECWRSLAEGTLTCSISGIFE